MIAPTLAFPLLLQVQCVSLSNDANLALTGADDGRVIIYDLRADGPLETLQASSTGAPIVGVQWSPDGTLKRCAHDLMCALMCVDVIVCFHMPA
jgi:WD40 repeat protein